MSDPPVAPTLTLDRGNQKSDGDSRCQVTDLAETNELIRFSLRSLLVIFQVFEIVSMAGQAPSLCCDD